MRKSESPGCICTISASTGINRYVVATSRHPSWQNHSQFLTTSSQMTIKHKQSRLLREHQRSQECRAVSRLCGTSVLVYTVSMWKNPCSRSHPLNKFETIIGGGGSASLVVAASVVAGSTSCC